ncbi:MAG: glycerophosphodiester phosphodiesterase family protein [Roseobacter sp.]
MLSQTIVSYREAVRLWMPLLAVRLFVRLVSTAVLVPLIGGMLAVALSFSGQSALTDQDIARFLLTPVGLIALLVVGSCILVTAVIEVSVMTAVLRTQVHGPTRALGAALHFLIHALPRLLMIASHVLLRVLLVALPFVALAGLTAAYLMREHDINFYLANTPFEYKLSVAVGVLCLSALAIILLKKVSAWAIALHFCVFDLKAPRRAFAESKAKMQGHRLDLTQRIVSWIILRSILASILVAIVGVLLAEVPQVFGENLRSTFMVTSILLVIWLVLNAVLAAIANGALADILNEEFERSLEARLAKRDVTVSGYSSNYAIVSLVAAGVALASLLASGVASNQFGGLHDVEVIGHRGAAGARPENTMAAVIKAVEDGADWVEIDVQESADGEIIVVHDSDFMKSAGVATKVWDVTRAELDEIDIGSWFDPSYAGERTPLLRDVLAAVKGRSNLLIELKYYGHDVDLENRVIALVEDAQMAGDIATMSLKYPAVQKMRSLRPDWRSGVLAATAIGDLSGLEGDFVAISAARVSAGLLQKAHLVDKDVYVWTVNDPLMMSRMISLGVDGLITDRPKTARDVIEHYATLSTPERVMLRLGDAVGFVFDLTPETVPEI